MMSTLTLEQWHEEISAAHERIKPWIRRTPLEHSGALSELYMANIYIKLGWYYY